MGKHIPQKQDNNYYEQKVQPGGGGIGLKKETMYNNNDMEIPKKVPFFQL